MEKNNHPKEVSCVALSLLLKFHLARESTLESLLYDLKFSTEYFLDEHNWIDFETFILITKRFKSLYPNEPDILFKMGSSILDSGSYGFIRIIMLLSSSPIKIYEKFPYFVSKSFTFIKVEFQQLEKYRIRLIYHVADGYTGYQDILQVARGAITVMPKAAGFKRSIVTLTEMERKAVFDIEVFPRKNVIVRFWEATLGKLKFYKEAIQTLEKNSQLIEEKYDQLKVANIQIDRQVHELKSLLAIGEIINKTFNGTVYFKSLLEDIKRNLGYDRILLALYHPTIEHLRSVTFIGENFPLDLSVSNQKIADLLNYNENKDRMSLKTMVSILTEEELKSFCPDLCTYFTGEFFYFILFKTKMNALGIIGVDNCNTKNFISIKDKEFLQGFVNQIVVGIDKTIYYNIIEDLNKNLEIKVKQRTTELTEAKFKLEDMVFQLKKLDKLKNDFVANVSHELKHPLLNMKIPLQSMIEGDFGELSPEVIYSVGIIQKSVFRLQKLIDDLLDYSKIEADKMFLNLEELDIEKYLFGLTEEIKFFAEKKRVGLIFKSYLKTKNLFFDPEKIEKIMANLLSNSLKFTPPGGTIKVTLSEIEDSVKIEVEDTGIGMSSEQLEKLFQRFVQVGNNREYCGTGIGLALSKELAELHCGTLDAVSTEGKGSNFILVLKKGNLPVTDWQKSSRRKIFRRKVDSVLHAKYNKDAFENAEYLSDNGMDMLKSQFINYLKPETKSFFDFNALDGSRKKILIVEDNSDTAYLIEFILEKNYQVFRAENGKTGLALALEIQPDLIISDIMMPVMDGEEFCKEIKNNSRTCHIPLILLTAKSGNESKITGLEAGADDFINKPFDINELRIKIKSLLGLREMHAKVKKHSEEQEQLLIQLKETQLHLVQAEKMASLGHLVSGMAHEFNNPLTIIKTYLGVCSKKLLTLKSDLNQNDARAVFDSDLWKDLEFIQSSISVTLEKIITMVNDLLEFSGIQSPDFSQIDLHNGIEEALLLLKKGWEGKINIVKTFKASNKVEGFGPHINQVVYNLLKNAIEAIPETGKQGVIEIKTQDIENGVQFSVKDNGKGIPQADQQKIYDPFFTTKAPGKNSGLGLSIVYSYLKEHQATVKLFSEQDKGSEFIITLPFFMPNKFSN